MTSPKQNSTSNQRLFRASEHPLQVRLLPAQQRMQIDRTPLVRRTPFVRQTPQTEQDIAQACLSLEESMVACDDLRRGQPGILLLGPRGNRYLSHEQRQRNQRDIEAYLGKLDQWLADSGEAPQAVSPTETDPSTSQRVTWVATKSQSGFYEFAPMHPLWSTMGKAKR